jgi:peptidoglycan-associated lipoprotein
LSVNSSGTHKIFKGFKELWFESLRRKNMTSSKICRQACLALTTSLLVFATGCSSGAKKADEAPASPSDSASSTAPLDTSASNAATPTTGPGADDNAALGDSDSGKALGLQTVHFPFDTYTLEESGKATLKANAEILKAQPNIKVQIEGHCDQRGGIQYNIALGEKRANMAKKYLQEIGISDGRITVISFGKEKLVDNGTSEDAYARNRRDNFVITAH